MLVRLNDVITRIVKPIVVIMVIVMVASILWQVYMRYIFNRPPAWSEELALLLFSWTMLLMTAVGVRESFHVSMDLLVDRLSPTAHRYLRAFIHLMVGAFGGYLVWAGILYAHGMHGTTSAAMGYPIVILYSAAPVSGFLILLYSLEHLTKYKSVEGEEL